jgi:hypothetical protein
MPFMEQDGFRLYYEDSGGDAPTYVERPDVFNREVGAFLDAHRPGSTR